MAMPRDTALVIAADVVCVPVMIPITILLAFILPGNRMMPLADLAVVTFRVAIIVALCRGNVFRSILISIPVMVADNIIAFKDGFDPPNRMTYADRVKYS